MENKATILGSGSWGTALAASLSKKGIAVTLWGRNPDALHDMAKFRENHSYLPGITLSDDIIFEPDLEKAVYKSGTIISAVTSQSFRAVMRLTAPFTKESKIIVNAAKGLEMTTNKRLSEIAAEEVPNLIYTVLSGPSHAEEVAKGMPTTLVAASSNLDAAEEIQDLFMSDRLRVYTNPDILGVELGGALKNIIALGAGISDGMGYGDNAKAAMMTRGISEISRLGVKMGALSGTFFGLSGIGDLIVTCTSMYSRNRRCGMLIGQGLGPDEAVRQIGMVVEGVYTAEAAYKLAQNHGVEMPITDQIVRILNKEADAKSAVMSLMSRGKKHEQEQLIL